MNDSHHRLRKLSDLGEDDPATPQWIWKGYLAPGTITVLCAGYKVGKSTLLTLLYDAMRNGGALAGEPVSKGIIHVASEEPERIWKARKKKFDLAGHVEVDIRPFPLSPSPEQWKNYVASFLDSPADLNVFDSTIHFLPEYAENDRERLRKAIDSLRVLSEAGRSVALVHQPAKGRGGDFNLRGYGIMDGEPDTLVEIKPPVGPDSHERQRIIQVRSRQPDYTPPRRLVELNAEGTSLAVLPMPVVDGTFETGWPALQFLLDDARERMTVTDIFNSWLPDFWKPSISLLRKWLEQAAREKKLERFGTGKKGHAFRYALPGKRFNPFGLDNRDMPDIAALDRERYGC